MSDLRDQKDRAAQLAGKGKLEKAAEAYRAILRSDPRDVASRHKLGELLRKLGDDHAAIGEYRQVADAYAREGLLIKAVAICKVILEIDPQGAMQVKETMPDSILVFVKTPTWDELRRRLEGRGSETAEQVETRLRTAETELALEGMYEHVIINDDVSRAADELAAVIRSHAEE